MLLEVKNVQQMEGEPLRRWFFSHEQDLWVWFGEKGQVVAFQLAYSKYRNEHAIRWGEEKGFRHYGVDDGESGPIGKGVPILVMNGKFQAQAVLNRFKDISVNIPREIGDFIVARLQEHPEYHEDT